MRWVTIFTAFLVGITFLFSGCAKPENKNVLVIISPHWEGMRAEYTEGFKAWHKDKFGEDVEIEWMDQGGTSDDIAFIKSEFARTPGGIRIDLFFGGGLEPYLELSKNGLLQQYKVSEEILSKIPQELSGTPVYDKDNYWYGVQLAGFGILYNKTLLVRKNIEPPRTWEDLGGKEFRGSVGSADPRHSGTMHMMYEIILQAYGWEKGFEIIHRMAGNVKAFSRSASQLAKDVTSGNVLAGLCLDSYGWAQIAEAGKDKLGFVFPEGLSIVNPDCIGILKGAPNAVVAQRFVEYVLSEEGQRLLLLGIGEQGGPKQYMLAKMSVMPELYAKVGQKCVVPVNPFTDLKFSLKYDEEKGSMRYGILNDLFGAMIIDTHDELAQKWSRIISAGAKKEDVNKFSRVPVSEQHALEFAKTKWNQSEFRNEKITEWVILAKDKYK